MRRDRPPEAMAGRCLGGAGGGVRQWASSAILVVTRGGKGEEGIGVVREKHRRKLWGWGWREKREKGKGKRKKGAGSREQGAGSREQGVRERERKKN